MNSLELADYLDNNVDAMLYTEQMHIDNAATMLRKQHAKIESYIAVLTEIANDYPELSHDKARMQNLDHIKLAKEVLK